MILTLHLTYYWYDLIDSGEKTEEYRLATDYWKKRIEDKKYDAVHVIRGYPAKGVNGYSPDVINKFKWKGFKKMQTIYPITGDSEMCYLVDLTERL